jgi:predicted lipase
MYIIITVAQLVYTFIEVRNVAKTSLKKFKEDYDLSDEAMEALTNSVKTDKEEETKGLFKEKTDNQISDAEIASAMDQFKVLFLPKNSTQVEEDIKKFKELSKSIQDEVITSIESINKLLDDSKQHADSLILHMVDDEFAATEDKFDDEATWAITINHLKKRITVVFRGSSVPKDWLVDFRLVFTPMKLHGPESEGPVIGKVHKGFYCYLYGNTQLGIDQRTISKAETILGELQALFLKHSDYRLYVTGHSLGAALSTLFAFRAAYDIGIPIKPIVNISFASPYVGDSEFRQHFEELEKQGKIRHLRVTNEDDVVPLAPFVGLHWGLPILYKHVGLNLKLYRNKGMFRKSLLKVSYPQLDSWTNGMSRAWENRFFGGITPLCAAYHSCVQYRNRLEGAKDELDNLSDLESLYHDEKVTGSLFKK